MELNEPSTTSEAPQASKLSLYEQDVIWFDRTFKPKQPRGWTEIIHKDPCSYCGCYGTPTREHVIPRYEGGSSRWDNIAAACSICNRRRDRMPILMAIMKPSKALNERWTEVKGPFRKEIG